jgi:hydroxymethylpyrimidine kinase/phosphomethylpyrimidine kinase/thiamine-phosphate diphosphorylase
VAAIFCFRLFFWTIKEGAMIRGLYLITDGSPERELLPKVQEALHGGARVVQYRDKTLPPPAQVAVARRLGEVCRAAGALFLVNDSPEVALQSGADGAHLGQGDMGVAEARALMGPGKIIGVSTRTVEQALAAERQGADYIGLGSIFPTISKKDILLVGLETLEKVRRAVKIPVVAIGGIQRDNAGTVIDSGADGVAVMSGVMQAPSPAVAAREISLLFNRRCPFPRGRVLTVAGSDSGGGAGIQADLKTVALLGGFGASAVTALTAQNTRKVQEVQAVSAGFVEAQIRAVVEDIGADTVKTGMLLSAEVVETVARAVERYALLAVVDPVMLAKGGEALLRPEAVATMKAALLPWTYLLTPNVPEAEALSGVRITTEADQERAARRLQQMGPRNVLVKGGHLPRQAVDILLAGDKVLRFPSARFDTPHTHGTGCSFSAAIATFLAQGLPLPEAVAQGKKFITEAIRTAAPLGGGHGPVNHWQGAKAVTGEMRLSLPNIPK